MPIYEYRCASCGCQKEFLRKVSDPALTTCPECGKETFSKMLTAAGFQLKGSGWYVTDFRNNGGTGKADTKSDTGKVSESSDKTDKTDKTEKLAATTKSDTSTPSSSSSSTSGDASTP
jgi:putative FmdB family regulatory protein